MLRDFRAWLDSELKLLGNASHHAYAFGQANMAKRALERFDAELAETLYVALDPVEGRHMLTALDLLEARATPGVGALEPLREALRRAVAEAGPAPF